MKMSFNKWASELKRGGYLLPGGRHERQQGLLALSVDFTPAQWIIIKLSPNGERALILFSVNRTSFEGRMSRLMDLKQSDQLADFIIEMTVVGNGSINISEAEIYLRWTKKQEEIANYLLKILNGIEKDHKDSWVFDAEKNKIRNNYVSSLVPVDLVEIVRNCLLIILGV